MNFKRIFTFGCSFTQYMPCTWADILRWDLDIPTSNYGMAGIGNEGIFCRMVECDLIHKFTEDDLIIVMWSSWSREDRYLDNDWKATGDILVKNFYDDDFIKKYWSLSNDIIKNSTAIISANRMFKPQFQGHIEMPLLGNLNNLNLTDKEMKLVKFYEPHISLNNIFKYNKNTEFSKLCNDPHPDLLEHLKFTKEVVYKSLGLTIKPNTEELCHLMYTEFINFLHNRGSAMNLTDRNNTLEKIKNDSVKKYKKI